MEVQPIRSNRALQRVNNETLRWLVWNSGVSGRFQAVHPRIWSNGFFYSGVLYVV